MHVYRRVRARVYRPGGHAAGSGVFHPAASAGRDAVHRCMTPEDAQTFATIGGTDVQPAALRGPSSDVAPGGGPTVVDAYAPAAAPVARKYNTQLYAQSALSGSAIERHYEAQTDALFNDKKPNLAINRESPDHRVIIFLKAQGLSNNEIARRTGHTAPWISQVLRQPWARVRLVEELREAGRDAVRALITASTEDSVYTLIDVRDDPKSRPSDRIAAARELLDRAFGKPTQHVESTVMSVSTPDSVAALDKEIATLEAETKRLTGN